MTPFSEHKKYDKIIFWLLFQMFILLAFARTSSYYYPEYKDIDLLVSVLALINVILSLFITQWIKNMGSLYSKVMKYEKSISTMEDTVRTMREERHEYINHLQSILGLTLAGEKKEVVSYINDIGVAISFNSQMLMINYAPLQVLLQNKSSKAAQHKIKFKVNVMTELSYFQINTYDLTTIFGNLIDNAIDCLVKNEITTKIIWFDVSEDNKNYIFLIRDSGPPISDSVVADIFKEGFSTKGINRGFGLKLVKDTLEKIGGTITYQPKPKGFTVYFPKSEVFK